MGCACGKVATPIDNQPINGGGNSGNAPQPKNPAINQAANQATSLRFYGRSPSASVEITNVTQGNKSDLVITNYDYNNGVIVSLKDGATPVTADITILVNAHTQY